MYVLIVVLWFIHIEKKIHMHTLNLHRSSSKVLGLGYTLGSKSKWISKIFDPKFQGIFQKYYDHWIQQLIPKLRILNFHIGKKSSVTTGHALEIWICGCSLFCRRDLWASKSVGFNSTYLKPQNMRVQKLMSQRSMGLCTHCTRANAFLALAKLILSHWSKNLWEFGFLDLELIAGFGEQEMSLYENFVSLCS